MRNLIQFCIFFLFGITSIVAQSETCDCKTDLDFIIEKLKKTPSYKKQIKGNKAIEFDKTYTNISAKMEKPITIAQCQKFLQEQITVIDDFHINLFSNYEALTKDDAKDSLKVKAFLNTEAFNKHPKTSKNLVKLNDELSNKTTETIEGIYNLGSTSIKIGIYKTSENEIEGVVLASDDVLWTEGQLFLTGTKNKFGKYNLLQYHLTSRKLRMLNSITYANGRLLSLKKVGHDSNFEFQNDSTSNWEFKQLSADVQYVYFGSFSNASSNVKAFKAFFNKHKTSFTASNIIVDLRENGGGNSKWSDPFLKLFKKSKAKIYVITNALTISNSEQFTSKLKQKLNATHLGQTTYGALSYGTNYGRTYTTPSGFFDILPTDMNFHNTYFEFEGYGIVPSIKLGFESDWITQTLDIITKKDEN